MKLTPVLVVPAIESLLPLWDALGFARTAEVPHGDRLGFVILTHGNAELMLQTVDSVRADEPRVLEGPVPPGPTSLFIEVDDLDAIVAKLPPGTESSSSAAPRPTAPTRPSSATARATW